MGRTLHNSVKIDVDLIPEIHREAIKSERKEELQFKDTVRDEGCLPSICEYEQFDLDSIERAAYYLHRIAARHPFIEGNKRNAYLVAIYILSDERDIVQIPYTKNIEDFIRTVASGQKDEEDIKDWIKRLISCSEH